MAIERGVNWSVLLQSQKMTVSLCLYNGGQARIPDCQAPAQAGSTICRGMWSSERTSAPNSLDVQGIAFEHWVGR
jgi:hypothetical protein